MCILGSSQFEQQVITGLVLNSRCSLMIDAKLSEMSLGALKVADFSYNIIKPLNTHTVITDCGSHVAAVQKQQIWRI